MTLDAMRAGGMDPASNMALGPVQVDAFIGTGDIVAHIASGRLPVGCLGMQAEHTQKL